MTQDENKNKNQEETNEEPIKKVPKKKVIYIELDEEITSVYDRVKKLQIQDMYLVMPERSVILQSVVNLKILKRKLTEIGKKVFIITTDPVGTKLALQAGIKVFDKIEDNSKVTKEILNPNLRIQPINASANELDDDSPSRTPQKKISILELVKNAKDGKKSFSFRSLWDARKKYAKAIKDKKQFSYGGPNKKALTTLVIASITMLLIIFYVALPGATIHLTAESNVLEASANVTLADADLNKLELDTHPSYTIASYGVETTVSVDITYNATGQLFSGENASGTITLTNEADYKWDLVPFSRLQSPDGVIFRTQQFVSVPAATDAGFSTVDVYVVADPKDSNDQVIGDRGNLPANTSFIFPALMESSQLLLYGNNAAAMTGGKTVVTKYVTQEDLDAAAKKVETELDSAIESTLQTEVDKMNSAQGSDDLVLLKGYDAFEKGTPSVNSPVVKDGDQVESFQISGSMTVSGISYNSSELVNILRNELKLHKSPEKQLQSIDESSVYYEIIDFDESSEKIKITATIKGVEEYVLDPEEESGALLIEKIKDHIAGKTIEEAKDYIENLPEINKVEIKSWPVWAPTIPTVRENIKIKVVSSK
ncbi:MAG: hypothetical protein WCT46_02490 [Candidatus Gracilibacteria bacterium]|jgi:hypothetical protein